MSKIVTWITGASSGMGKALVKNFLENGKNVVASARKQESLDMLKKEYYSYSGSLIIMPMDVSNSAQVESVHSQISAEYQIECLINNAGITSFKPAVKDSIKEIQDIININLLGAIYTTKYVLPAMIENKKGTIINILSVAAKKIFTKSSAYAASKSGLLSYMNVLREEVRDHNIKIVNILPGATKTPIWPGEVLEKFSDRMMTPDDVSKFIYNLSILDSNLTPEEVTLRPVKGDL